MTALDFVTLPSTLFSVVALVLAVLAGGGR